MRNLLFRKFIAFVAVPLAGTFLLTSCGSNSDNAERIIASPDITPPIITLNGTDTITIIQNTPYNEEGATALDDTDGVTDITISGTVNTNITDTYIITYTATDSAGNISNATRSVEIVSPADTTSPTITLNGANTLIIAQGSTYNEAGATAIDKVDGAVDVTISGTVDTSTPGAHIITYLATDNNGNTASATRSITVTLPVNIQTYPSTATSWVIPTYPENTFNPAGYPLSTKEDLINWELDHADIAFGSGYDKSAINKINTLGYMYTQSINFSPATTEFGLRSHAKSVNENYEDYFLHFSEDTTVEIQNASHSEYTPLNQVPWLAGWTREPGHSGFLIWQRPPYAIEPFSDSAQGGYLFIYMPEKFDQIEFVLTKAATTGQLTIEYPSRINPGTGVVDQWGNITPNMADDTQNLQISGTIRWTPPADWVEAATYDTTAETGGHFSNRHLKKGEKTYLIRISRVNADSDDQPIVENIMTKDFMPYINDIEPKRLIPGWDNANDLNNDGYVDDAEFDSRSNTNASAKFRYESRVTPLGNMWNQTSTFQRPDFLNPSYQAAIASVITKIWQDQGLAGAYNDDVFKLDDIAVVNTGIGGETEEHATDINEPAFKTSYKTAFLETIKKIKMQSGSSWVAANTSAENLFKAQDGNMEYIDTFSTFLREDYLRPGQGLDGYFGIAKMWDTFALAKENKHVLIVSHTGASTGTPFINTKADWESGIATSLAMYYLINIPGKTSFTSWNSSFNYGSDNTTTSNYYQAGIPKNIAYQPSFMLAVDIGEPTKNIQTWSGQTMSPLLYTIKTNTNDYEIVGSSTQSVLTHAAIATFKQQGSVPVVPANIYYAWQSTEKMSINNEAFPKEMILARDYSKALILYRTDFFGRDANYASTSHTLTLPGHYQRLNYDGTLQTASNTITLTGYEGVVLIKVRE